jgi:hypothetical protein
MFSQNQIKQLQDYRNKSFVSSILFQKHSNFYNLMKNIIKFPLIIISSVMGLINSNFEPEKNHEYNFELFYCFYISSSKQF